MITKKYKTDRVCPKCKRVYYKSNRMFCIHHFKTKTALIILNKIDELGRFNGSDEKGERMIIYEK